MKNTYRILVGNLEGMRTLVDISLDGKIIIKWDSRKLGVSMA